MPEVNTKTGPKGKHSWHSALILALFLGLLISLFDALQNTLYEVPRQAAFLRVLEPLAGKIIMIVLLYEILWLLLFRSLRRSQKLNPEALSVSLGVFIAVGYILFSSSIQFTANSLLQNARAVIRVIVNLVAVLVFSWAAYSATKVISKSKWRALVVAVCLAVPLLLAETIVAAWVNKCLLEPLPARLTQSDHILLAAKNPRKMHRRLLSHRK